MPKSEPCTECGSPMKRVREGLACTNKDCGVLWDTQCEKTGAWILRKR